MRPEVSDESTSGTPSGTPLTLEVREQEGLRSYTAVADGRERFPGVVEVVDLGTGEVELQLVEVSER